jgi:hypothetical protein
VAHLDGLVLHGVEHREAGHDLAGGEHLNLEIVVGDLADALGEHFAGAVERVERLRPARRQPPSDLRRRLGDGRHGDRADTATDRSQELTALHDRPELRPSLNCTTRVRRRTRVAAAEPAARRPLAALE